MRILLLALALLPWLSGPAHAAPAPRLQMELTAPNAPTTIAVTADARIVAGAAKDGTVYLWSLPDGHLLRTIRTGTSDPSFSQFEYDGRTLLVGGPKTMTWWSVPDGRALGRIGTGSPVWSATRDGSLIAAAGSTTTVRNGRTGRVLQRFTTVDDTAAVNCAAFSSDGKQLAVGGYNWSAAAPALPNEGELYVRDLAARKTSTDTIGFEIQAAAYAPGARKPAVGGRSHPDEQTGGWVWLPSQKYLEPGPSTAVRQLAYDSTGSLLAVLSDTLDVWDVSSRTVRWSLGEGIGSVASAASASVLVTAGPGPRVRVWTL